MIILVPFGSGKKFLTSFHVAIQHVSLFISANLGPSPKPTRLLTNMEVNDSRCHFSMPKFDSLGHYKGPLPRKCGHRHSHSLIGKTGTKWNTSPSAAYPPQMCSFIADLILKAAASFGGGVENKSKVTNGTK